MHEDEDLTRVLVTLSNAEQTRGAFSEAMAAGREARTLAQRLGDVGSEASATGNLALVALKQGRTEEAEAGLMAAVGLFRRTGDQRAVAIGLGNLGVLAVRRGDPSAAASLHSQALDGARLLRDTALEGWALANIAGTEIETGDLNLAADHVQLGLRKLIEAEDVVTAVSTVNTFGRLLARCGDVAGAAIAWSAASANAASMEIPVERDDEEEAEVSTAREMLQPSAWEECRQRGAELDLSEAMHVLTRRLRAVAIDAGGSLAESAARDDSV